MKKPIAKKTIILYILKMLKDGSSKDKPITLTNMTKVLNSMDIPCDRKTVGRNVEYLIEFGYPIVRLARGGCYFEQIEHFSKNDSNLLVELIEKNISKFENKNIKSILIH